MEVVDTFEDDDIQVGISPLGTLLVILLGIIGLMLFLNPSSTMYDFRIGGIIAVSIPIAFAPGGLQRWQDEGDLPKTFLLALIGAVSVSLIVSIVYTVPVLSVLTVSTVLVLALPPIFEELVFRVGLFFAFQRVMGTEIAIIFQAIIFGLYHFFVWEVSAQYAFVLFMGGVIFQIIFLMSKNILSSMIAHAIVNLKPHILAILMSPFVFFTVGLAIVLIFWRRSRNGE